MINIKVKNFKDDKFSLDVNGVVLSATKRGDSDGYIVYFNNKVSGVAMGNKTLSKKVLDDALANNTTLTFEDKPRESSGVRTSTKKSKVEKVATDEGIAFMYGDLLLVNIDDPTILEAFKMVDDVIAKASTDAEALATKIAQLQKIGITIDSVLLDVLKDKLTPDTK